MIDGGTAIARPATRASADDAVGEHLHPADVPLVRLGLIGAVLAIFVSLIAYGTTSGWPTSISALFYTPEQHRLRRRALRRSRSACSRCRGTASSRRCSTSPAVVVPLIAIVPTVIQTGDVPGLTVECGEAARCVPRGVRPGIANGMVTFAVIGGMGVVLAVVLAVVQRTISGGLLLAIAIAAVIIAGMTIWWAVDPASFVPSAHLVATVAFLSLMALVSLMAAAGAGGTSYRAVYGALSVLFVLSLIFVVIVSLMQFGGADLITPAGAPLILIGEAIALAVFGDVLARADGAELG